jgi:DNA cross-link repair 1A protein
VLGLPDTAPPVPEDIKDTKEFKAALSGDVDESSTAPLPEEDEDHVERSKQLMQGWLVKKEEGDVKAELDDGQGGDVKDVKVGKRKGRTLVLMGTYSIGKERIVKGVARALGSKIYCDTRKKGILLCEDDPELHAMLTNDPLEVCFR